MIIYFVRHGETDWNKTKRLQGQSDIALNEFGCNLAVKTGKGMADIRFDKVYSSPLIRARQTADILVAENHHNHRQEIIFDDRITEINFGVYEGLCCSEEGWNLPDDNFKNFLTNCSDYITPEGAESFQDITDRVEEFLKDLFADETLRDKVILVVSHGAAIRGILNCVINNPASNYWAGGVHKNCAVSTVVYDGNEAVLERENHVYYDDIVADW